MNQLFFLRNWKKRGFFSPSLSAVSLLRSSIPDKYYGRMGISANQAMSRGTINIESEFWMRPLSFAGLKRCLCILAQTSQGMRAGEWDSAIKKSGAYLTSKGTGVSRTTLYHCRNTLVRLNAVRRIRGVLSLNIGNKEAIQLVSRQYPGNKLDADDKESFARLVFANPDCCKHFFTLFLDQPDLSVEAFCEQGISVSWTREDASKGNGLVSFVRAGTTLKVLSTPNQVKSILYGVRYWALRELDLIDEFFREDRQNIMFPLSARVSLSIEDIVAQLLAYVRDEKEWTILSVHDLLEKICEKNHVPLTLLYSSLSYLSCRAPEYVVLIPTSERIASMTASTPAAEDLQQRSYYRDSQKRFISHLRIHRNAKGKAI